MPLNIREINMHICWGRGRTIVMMADDSVFVRLLVILKATFLFIFRNIKIVQEINWNHNYI